MMYYFQAARPTASINTVFLCLCVLVSKKAVFHIWGVSIFVELGGANLTTTFTMHGVQKIIAITKEHWKRILKYFLFRLAEFNKFYLKMWIMLKIRILNLRSFCLFLDIPLKLCWNGKHTPPSFKNIILIITEV